MKKVLFICLFMTLIVTADAYADSLIDVVLNESGTKAMAIFHRTDSGNGEVKKIQVEYYSNIDLKPHRTDFVEPSFFSQNTLVFLLPKVVTSGLRFNIIAYYASGKSEYVIK